MSTDPIAAFAGVLAGHWSQAFHLCGGDKRTRERLLDDYARLAAETGQVVVRRSFTRGLDESSLVTDLIAGLQAATPELCTGSDLYFAREMLAVAAGETSFANISLEARERLRALAIYDAWTIDGALEDALRISGELARRQGRRLVLVYGETHCLRDGAKSWPLTTLLGSLKRARYDYQGQILPVLSGTQAGRRQMSLADIEMLSSYDLDRL